MSSRAIFYYLESVQRNSSFEPAPGSPTFQIVRDLVAQLLLHAKLRSPSDVEALYCIALLQDPDDIALLASLLGVPTTQVGVVLDELRKRYDLVDLYKPQLHQDIQHWVRQYLLDPVERASLEEVNSRAIGLLSTKIANLSSTTLETLVTNPDQQQLLLSTLWHLWWLKEERAIELLEFAYPAAVLLDPEFASNMNRVAEFFFETAPAAVQQRLDLVQSLSAGSGSWRWIPPVKGVSALLQRKGVNRRSTHGVRQQSLPTDLHWGDKAFSSGYGSNAAYVELLLASTAAPMAFDVRIAHLEEASRLLKSMDLSLTRIRLTYEALLLAGRALLQSETHGDIAVRAASIVLELDSRNVLALRCKGLGLIRIGEWSKASTTLREAVDLAPDWPELRADLSLALRSEGKPEEAIRSNEDGIQSSGRRSPLDAISRAPLLRSLGQSELAIAELTEAAKVAPNNVSVFVNLGETLLHEGDLIEAERTLRTAVELGGGSLLPASVLLGIVLWNRDAEEAKRWFTIALTATGRKQSLFERHEYKAIAQIASGNAVGGIREMRLGLALRSGWDLFEPSLYRLLSEPHMDGIDAIIDIWIDILRSSPQAICRCRGCMSIPFSAGS